MGNPVISGIQQIGVGVSNVREAFHWYRRSFGMDIVMFDEAAEAALMLPYTGGQPRKRHAILSINIQGGGGLELWQYLQRTPQAPDSEPLLGDLGIYIAKFKTANVDQVYEEFKKRDLNLLCSPIPAPDGRRHFYLKDPYHNICEVVSAPADHWFLKGKASTGGVYGCTIGVSNIENARKVYSDILGYDKVVYDQRGVFEDFESLPGGSHPIRRVLLQHSEPRRGSFSRLLGATEIELVSTERRRPAKIFRDRYWGDLGFIHLCFDIRGMADMRALCDKKGFPFTVDSASSFDMGEAAGHFSYIEDPDGTLIEFVETHKIPLLKKLNWHLDLRKRDPERPLPRWMLRALAFNRVKD